MKAISLLMVLTAFGRRLPMPKDQVRPSADIRAGFPDFRFMVESRPLQMLTNGSFLKVKPR